MDEMINICSLDSLDDISCHSSVERRSMAALAASSTSEVAGSGWHQPLEADGGPRGSSEGLGGWSRFWAFFSLGFCIRPLDLSFCPSFQLSVFAFAIEILLGRDSVLEAQL